MSEQAAPEPTMEEILASIRRIISEDDAPGAEAAPAAEPEPEAEPAQAAAPEPEPKPEPADDVLELTDKVETAPAETVGDIAAYEEPVAAAPAPEPEPLPAPPPKPKRAVAKDEDGLVSEGSAMAAASAFGALSAAVAMPSDGQTLDGVVRDLLRPLLKAWLDEHLPAIVEAKVAEEVERISRTRVR